MFSYHHITALVSATIFLALSSSANAQDKERTAGIEEVTVVGIRQPFRGDVPLDSQPQGLEVLTTEKLENNGITGFVQALNLSASVAQQNNFGGLWDSFAIRGLAGDENIPSGHLINGYTSGRGYSGTRDASNIERIEIMKGPGSALYGRSEPGGTINVITKKPQFVQSGQLQFSAGRWNSYRASGDYTNGINDRLAFRINGAYEDSESFRDYVTSQKTILTPSLLWLVSDTVKIGYEMEYVDQESVFDRGIIAIGGNLDALPRSRFLGEPDDDPTQVEVKAHQLTLQQDFGDWSLLAGLSYKDSSFISTSSDAELAPARQFIFSDGETLSRQNNERDFQTTDASARLELSGNVSTGSLENHLLIGVDGYKFNFDRFWRRFRPAVGDDTYSINVNNPVYGKIAPEGAVLSNLRETQHSYGLYIQDQIDLSEKWKVLLGGRYDTFDQTIDNHINSSSSDQDQSTFSPRAGVVYTLSDKVSLYASLSQGFRPNTGADVNGDAFEPEITKSKEVGVKFNLNSVSGSVALFYATKNNMLTTDVDAGVSTALGKVQSQGVELDLNKQFTASASLWFSYAYTDAKTSKSMVNTDWWVALPKGSRLLNIPEHSANATLKQDFNPLGFNAEAGISLQYVGERLGEAIDPDYLLPSYTLVNLFGNYRVSDALSVQLNIDNLLDETYYANSYSAVWTQPGIPRQYRVSLKYRF